MRIRNLKSVLPVAMLCAALVVSSCGDGDDAPPPVEYSLTVGDTVITIPGAAVTFANERYSIGAYFVREYHVATDTTLEHPGATFQGTLLDWKSLGWSVRQTFLLPPYTRDVRVADDAQYYYQIGTFTPQFGYGWRDTFDPEADLNVPGTHIWRTPADTTLIADNPATIGFDGQSHFLEQYRGLWRFEQ